MDVETQGASSDHSREHYNALGERYTEILEARAGTLGLGGDHARCRMMFDLVRRHCRGCILELCCGPGNFSFALAEGSPGSPIVALDHSETFIRIARGRNRSPNLAFSVQDAGRLAFADGTFDTTVLSLALHEMEADAVRAVLREMKRVTREGGRLVIIELHVPENPLVRLFFERGLGEGERPTTYTLNAYGLPRFLADEGIALAEHRITCLSTLQIAVGVKGPPVVPAFRRDFTSIDPWHHVWLPAMAGLASAVSGLLAHPPGAGGAS